MATLTEALYALPTPRLRALVRTRNIDPKKLAMLPNKRQLTQFLANELSRPPSVSAAIQQCNARELRLLQLLLLHGSDRLVPWREVVATVGDRSLSNALAGIVERLEELGLAFRLSDGVFVPPSVRMQVPVSLPDRFTLEKCLSVYDAPTLRHIYEKLELRPAPGNKNENIAAIRAHLLDHGPGLRLNRALTAEELAVLEYIVQAGGAASASDVATAVLGGRVDEFYRYDWQNRWKTGRERNAVDSLLARGILHVGSLNYGYNLFLLLPGDLLRVLTGGEDNAFWTAPPVAPAPLPAPPVVITHPVGLLRDVVALLAFLSVQEAVRTNSGHIHRTSLKNIARLLSRQDERYAAFLYAVCREANLIQAVGDRHVYTVTSHGSAWLRWEAEAQKEALFAAWRDGLTWTEMYKEPLQKNGDYRPKDALLTMRQTVLNLVTENAASDAFLELGSLTEALAFRYPLLLAQSAMMGPDLVASPTAFVKNLVAECLAWLELTELGWAKPLPAMSLATKEARKTTAARAKSEPEAPTPDPIGYRLTPLGRRRLGVETNSEETLTEEPREDQFIVQANAEIFVPPFLEPATLYRLLILADSPAKGAAGNTVSLTRESIRRALDQGETPRDLLAFLQAHSRTGIPQNVEYLINEVGGKHGHIRIGKAQMYLQVDTPLLLKELQARKELKPYFVRELSDTIALLNADDPDKLLRELRKAGYLPVQDDTHRLPRFSLQESSVPPARKPASTLDRASKRAAKADSAVDWERIALEDEI